MGWGECAKNRLLRLLVHAETLEASHGQRLAHMVAEKYRARIISVHETRTGGRWLSRGEGEISATPKVR